VLGGLTLKLRKIPLIYSVSNSIWGGLELCLGGLSPPKPAVATGLIVNNLTAKPRICVVLQGNVRKCLFSGFYKNGYISML